MPESESKTRKPARERLLDAALARFNHDGYNGAGIDAIIADAGIARMTLYNHFPSKDALIEAVLARRHENLTAFFKSGTERRAATPRDRLLAVFDVLGDWFESADFRGCLFVRAVGELGESHPAIRDASRHHKAWYLGFLADTARAAALPDPESLAADLLLLVEGATARAAVSGGGRAEAMRAKRIAEKLLMGC